MTRRPALAACLLLCATPGAFAAAPACPRGEPGDLIHPPTDLYSHDGSLTLGLNYETGVDKYDYTLFCFKTLDNVEAPVLHVKPGDNLNITLHNLVPLSANPDMPPGMAGMDPLQNSCGAKNMQYSSVNMHFHGTNTTPLCHSDNVTETLVNSGDSFKYVVHIPKDEPPGLYWYHPHVHMISEAAVLGGGSGALVVDGIENLQPAVAGLPVRELILRDQDVVGSPPPHGKVPSWDVSVNYVPITYPKEIPAQLAYTPAQQEFWRVVNASADTIMDLALNYDGKAQLLQIVALDGVATGSQDGTRKGKLLPADHILLPPAGRAEFIMTTPDSTVKHASFLTRKIETGPIGDNDIDRVLATMVPDAQATFRLPHLPQPAGTVQKQRFEGLDGAPVTAKRKLYFSEHLQTASRWAGDVNFFITVDGATPEVYNATNPPAIIAHQGDVEEWTIENRTRQVHEFHMHQIHFKQIGENGVPVPKDQQQFRDTLQVPYWSGTGPFPSVTLLMDFRGNITGDFVYHCHILGHEDHGMMAKIEILPKGVP